MNKLWAIVLSSITNAAASIVEILIVCKLDNSEITNLPSSFAIVSATLYKAPNSAPHVEFVHSSKNPSSTNDGHKAVDNNDVKITVLVVSLASANTSLAASNVAKGIDSLN